MKTVFSLCAVVLTGSLMAACASDAATVASVAPAASGADRAGSDMICAKEYPTGSNIAVTKCRTREEVEAERAAGAQGVGRAQAGGPSTKMGGN
jgi:hypothetical protein